MLQKADFLDVWTYVMKNKEIKLWLKQINPKLINVIYLHIAYHKSSIFIYFLNDWFKRKWSIIFKKEKFFSNSVDYIQSWNNTVLGLFQKSKKWPILKLDTLACLAILLPFKLSKWYLADIIPHFFVRHECKLQISFTRKGPNLIITYFDILNMYFRTETS